jgi:hypothetical protein
MSEPGIPTRRPGHWLEYVSTALAVVVSLTSLWVAIGSEQANRQMVAASSWPFLEVGSSSVDSAGKSVLTFSVDNTGVGPAKVRSFEVFYKNKPVRGAVELVRDCCNPKFTRATEADGAKAAGEYFITGGVPGFVIRAGETRKFIIYSLSPQTQATWLALNRARQKDISFRICYCSVFDECWRNTVTPGTEQLDPARVDACPVPPVPYKE